MEELPGTDALPDPALSRLRLRHLTCFVAIAEERTLAGAAVRLGLSQPAVSKTLAELELVAGRRLVDRGRSGAALTDAGTRFLRHALEVTGAMASASQALVRESAPGVAPLRIGALPTVAGGVLARALARLHRERPHAWVQVVSAANPELVAALTAGRIDCAIGRMAEPSTMRGISFELLYTESLAVVARPGHPLAAAGADRPTDPAALRGYPLLVPESGTAPRLQADALLRSIGPGTATRCTETQSLTVARAVAVQSDAVWITSRHAVRLDVEQGWLTALDVPVPQNAEPVGILRRSRARPTDLAEEVFELIRASI
ncbi:LysR substrate-binding domain-containing protein [Actinacidiphila sp. bgisy144]|uniref:LysR substrate-binding domain-containing protein n=1 Tax=Actinacidiphila sp. bgisy144 TaxID=3413791 RepID=UPI003EBC25D0